MNAKQEWPDLSKHERPAPRLLYPSMIVAAVSVTLVSLLGIAGLTGHMPTALGSGASGASMPVAEGTSESAPSHGPVAQGSRAQEPCLNCGVVESVHAVETRGSGSGAGAVIGGLAGAVIGNTMGAGSGRTAMTLIGGGAGAYAGNEIEKNSKRRVVWQTRVRMDDGSLRKISSPAQPDVAVGAKVRIVNGQIVART
ncbi:MAG: hypothetical protein IOMNBAOH_00513 [Rhodocyclaceae bacterium]|jgi:outer membrane lipoprotein SlyB|nr:hypothetical protein [Rhodocyclaceae bacterium]